MKLNVDADDYFKRKNASVHWYCKVESASRKGEKKRDLHELPAMQVYIYACIPRHNPSSRG